MAVGTGFGFDVNALQKALDALDKNLAKVIQKGEDANKAFAAMFKGKDGIAFNKQLVDIKKNLELISREKDPLKWNSKDLGAYVDQINRMVHTVEKMNQLAGTKGYKKIVPIDTSELQNIQKELLATYREVTKLEQKAEKQRTARNQTYSGALRFSDKANTLEKERQAIENLKVARDKLKQSDADYADKLNRLNEAILKHEKHLRDATKTNNQKAEEDAKVAQRQLREEQRLYEERARLRREENKKKNQTYEGAIAFSSTAKTLNREIQAVKNLEAARAKLSKTDADYTKKLDELNTRIRQHNQNIERATAGTKKLNGALATIGRGIVSAFSVQAIRGYVNQMIKVRGEMELQQKSLQAILQNKDAANEIWQKTIDLAVRSPFRIKELVTYTKQLAAYRVEADKLYETNKMLADVSAGLGVDMQRLILAFGQVKAANFLRGTELRQFTEAGIPMLDELAKHFNDMNNTALTSADVFEMISKRMVLFEDVEAVFERLTKAGGTFYRMQEIQAETLRGQISNLKDSIDIMLNDMGKANDGTMKFAVKAVKTLVDNYERLVPILKAVATAIALYKLNAFLAARQTGILSSMLLNAGVAMEKFTLTMAKNPWTLIITAIIAAGAAMYRFHKQLKEVDKTYRDMLNQQSEITAKFFKAEDIDERKRALKDLIEYAEKEYSIKVSLDLKDMSDSDVTDAMNRLRQQMIKANAFGATFQKELLWANALTFWEDFGTRGIFEQGLNRDIDQMGDSYDNLNRILVNNLSPTIDYLSTKLENLNEDQRDALKSLKAGIGEWSNNDEDMVDYFDRIRGNYETLIGLLSKSDNIADKKIASQLKKYQRRYNEAEKEFQAFIHLIDDDVAKLNDEDKTIFLSAAIDDAKSEKNWSEFEETQIRKWLEKKYEIELTPKIVEEDKELKAWQESYNDLFEGKTGWRKIRTKGTSQTQVIEQLNAQYKATEELVKRIQKAGEDSILEGGAYEGENLEKLKKDLADIREQLDWFGAEDKKDKNKESASIKILQKRINLLKEVNKKYLELEKTFDAVTAKEKVMEAYSDTFREAFAGTGVELDMYKVMTQVIGDSGKVGEDMGKALSNGMLEKLRGLEEAGTYIRKASKDIFEQLKKDEGFKNWAYPDIGGGWSIGIASQMWPDRKPVKEGDYWTDEQIWEYSQDIIAEHEKRLNDVLDLHKDIVVTQEQYNALLNQTWQSGTASPVFTYAKDAKKFYDWLKKIDGIPIVRVFQRKRADGTTYNERVKTGKTFDIDVDAIMRQYNELETIHEKMALVMQYTSIRTKAYGDTTQFMIDRSLRRSQQFRGDLDIAKQLESVLVRIAGMDFTTTEGMVEALGKLKKIAEKEGPEAKNILSQAISGLEAEIGLRVKKDADKQLNKEVEDLFDQYELTLDLKKLNLPKQAAGKLFDMEYLDLNALRKAVEDRASEFVGTEQAEQYKKFLEKIDELERKDLVERTKKYLEYAKSTISERAKIKMEELTKMREIEETFKVKQGDSKEVVAYKKDMRLRAGLKAREEAQKALQSLEWDEFQKTDTFTSLFDDIDNASDALVTHMIKKLRDFKAEWKDMPLEDMKSIVNKINELEVALAERSPWKAYRIAKKAVKKAREDAKYSFESEDARDLYGKGKSNKDYIAALQIENAYQEQKVANVKEEMAVIEEMLALKEGTLPYEIKVLNYSDQQLRYAAMTTQQLRDLLKKKKKEVGIANDIVLYNGQIIIQYKNQEKSLKKQAEVLGEVQNMANDLYDAFVELSEALGADSDSPAAIFADMGMNMLNAILNAIMLQTQLKAIEVGAYAVGTAMNTAMGIVGWIVMGIQLVVEGINAIAKANDNKIVAQLEEQAEIIERQRDIYEQLEERVEKAYNVSQLQQLNKELERSVELEIQALEASIALEKSRKNADEEQIKQYEEEIAEARKRLVESTQEMMEEMGGIFDLTDFASGFVDAWWDAMEEGKSGLDALSEHFDETMADMVKKQALYKGASKIMEQLQNAINAGLDKDFSIDQAEWDAIVETAKKANIDLDKFLKGYRAMFEELSLGSEGGLSGLQKGISGMSEQQAEILTAYWNSVRGYTASIDSKMDLILANLNVSAEDNPMLAQLMMVAKNTSAINTLLSSLVKSGHTLGGSGIKVFMS